MEYNRVIVFCDYGLDDAVATLHILRNTDMFEHIDIVPIGGNMPVDIAYRNAHTLLAAAGADTKKVRIVDTRGISQPAENIPDIHGDDGMGGILAPRKSAAEVISFDEFKAELSRLHDLENDCVLSLGPCTVPVLLGYYPDMTVAMGGTTSEPPNYGDYEFNEGLDRAAFKTFAENAVAVATLDSCHDKAFGFETLKFGDELTDRLMEKYLTLCESRNAPVAVYDYVAALYVTNPELFELHRVYRSDGVGYNEIKYNA